MDIFIYSDESGVFDQKHNKFFVFAGILFISSDERDIANRKYLRAERYVRLREKLSHETEIKASRISNQSKSSLYRSLNNVHKFGIIVSQDKLLPSIFCSKKTKQRYLDWAYKIAIKRKFERLIYEQEIDPENVENLYFFVDEHTTATDGIYELREGLLQELKYGTHNWEYLTFYPPLFPHLKNLQVNFCNSSTKPLIRASDIVANKLYHSAVTSCETGIATQKFNIIVHP